MRSLLALLLLAGCRPPEEVAEELPPLSVKLETVTRAPFQPMLTLLGVVRPAGEAAVLIPSPGRLQYPGRFRDGLSSGVQVRAGEVLARLYNTDTEQSLAEAQLRLDSASMELHRYQKAFEVGVVPAAQVAQYKAAADLARQQLEAARQRRSGLDLRSPVSGWLLVEQRLPPESMVQAGAVLARVAAGGAPRVEARAASADRHRLREGLAVRFAAAGSPQGTEAARGIIREISPLLDAGGTIPIVAEVTAGDALPSPGEGVEVRVELDPRPQALTVPEGALMMYEGGVTLYVKEGKVARRRSVTLGTRSDDRVEVLTGLSPGDKVVVSGAIQLSDGDPIEPIEEPGKGPQ